MAGSFCTDMSHCLSLWRRHCRQMRLKEEEMQWRRETAGKCKSTCVSTLLCLSFLTLVWIMCFFRPPDIYPLYSQSLRGTSFVFPTTWFQFLLAKCQRIWHNNCESEEAKGTARESSCRRVKEHAGDQECVEERRACAEENKRACEREQEKRGECA